MSAVHERDVPVTVRTAAALLHDAWGLVTVPREVGSLEDQVFDVRTQQGERLALKVYATGQDVETLDAERAAVEWLSQRLPDIALPVEVPALRPGPIGMEGRIARVVTWVEGETLGRAPYLTPSTLVELGRTSGRCSAGLAGFDHPGLHRESAWDVRRSLDVVAEARVRVPSAVRDLVDRGWQALLETAEGLVLDALPVQAVHHDVTDWNVLGSRLPDGSFRIDGVIDFGDMVWTWRAGDLATAAHAAIGRQPEDPLGAVLSVLAGFCESVTLTPAEVDGLWHLVLRRALTCAVLETIEYEDDPENAYLARVAETDLELLRAVLEVHPAVAVAAVRAAAGHPPVPAEAAGDPGAVPLLSAGAVLEVLSSWGEVECSTEPRASLPDPPALHTDVRVRTVVAAPLGAPFAARVVDVAPGALVLESEAGPGTVVVTLEGVDHRLEVGAVVGPGDALCVVASSSTGRSELVVHLGRVAGLPRRGAVRDREVLAALCPDPSVLLGLEPVVLDRRDALRTRRKYLAPSQGLYYAEPAQVVRGQGQWLWDRTGQRLLDAVNNVAAVGHAHPLVTAAATEQLALHNTNSRFLYDATAEFAELVAQQLPEELHSLFFVNSGSEGVDLALQLARVYTGRRDVVVHEGSYHGWTGDVFELCTMPADRPDWRDTLAPEVLVTPAPDPFRGPFGSDAQAYLATLEGVISSSEEGPAAFVSEALIGSQGGIAPPLGYLRGAYERTRAAGALCIADEVQVGYGRTGKTFWAFEAEGAVPDIVVAAKSVGNGHPVGFVACRPEIAEEYARRRSFFATAGGGPVSCRIGSAVLEIIRDERLQENAQAVGTRLKQALEVLACKHAAIGAVHGRGLYLGIDLVDRRDPQVPMPEDQVLAIVERMRRLGVITQPTGVHLNVLKVKPPLCFTADDAGTFVAQLDRTLRDLEPSVRPARTDHAASLRRSS